MEGREPEGAKILSWVERVAEKGAQKRKINLVFHTPETSEDLIMVLPPQEVLEVGAREWE